MNAAISVRRRHGFSLIELLVVISIISLLMGLLLPAVQKAREVAARAACGNNLKQIGLAMRHYEFNKRCLPPSRTYNQSATWAVLILPYMDQEPLFQAWDLSKPYVEQKAEARQTAVPSYFCPSRRDAESAGLSLWGDMIGVGDNAWVNYPGALGDYAASIGAYTKMGDQGGSACPGAPPPDGAFQMGTANNKGVRLQDITDGLSNTILAGEKHVPLQGWGQGYLDNSLYNGSTFWSSTRAAGAAYPLAQSLTEERWCFGSYHWGICQFVFADGSVRMLPNSIPSEILGYMASRNDGQVIPGDY